VKVLVIVQSFVIAYLALWVYENYQNDAYFQAYVNSSLQGSGFAIVALSSVGIFSAVAMGLYLKLRSRRGEGLTSKERLAQEGHSSKTLLDPHVEQHLIEMIRKSTPGDGSTGSSSMPILKQEES
jgi:hypothetical protein